MDTEVPDRMDLHCRISASKEKSVSKIFADRLYAREPVADLNGATSHNIGADSGSIGIPLND